MRRLANQMQGQISHFYQRAAAQARIGGLDQTGAVQRVPQGQLRYVNNNGQETIYVELAYAVTRSSSEETPKKSERHHAILAVDVIIDLEYYRSVSVSTFHDENYYSYYIHDRFGTGVAGGMVVGSGAKAVQVRNGIFSDNPNPTPPGVFSSAGANSFATVSATRPNFDPIIPAMTIPPDPTIDPQVYPKNMVMGYLLDTEGLGSDAPVSFDLYLASSIQNVKKAVEDYDLTRTIRDNLTFTIRARELSILSPVCLIFVPRTGEMRLGQKTSTPIGGTPPEYSVIYFPEDVLPDKLVTELSCSWYANTGWTDPGGDMPLASTEPHMGELLLEIPEQTRVVASQVHPGSGVFDTEPIAWVGPLTDMTKVASIRWTPSGQYNVPGSARVS